MNTTRHFIGAIKQRADAIVGPLEPNMPSMGLFIVVWHIGCIIVSLRHGSYHGYENVFMRTLMAATGLPLVLFRQLPRFAKRYFSLYCLVYLNLFSSYFCFFMAMKSGWSPDWTMSSLVSIMLMIVVVCDWLFIAPLTGFALLLAYLTVAITDGRIRYTYIESSLPAIIFGITGCIIVTLWKEERHKLRISLMKSLSGSIAHEMRTPLNAITLASGAIKAMLPEHLGNTSCATGTVNLQEETLQRIHDIIGKGDETIRRSNKIIDSLLSSLNGNDIDRRHFRLSSAATTIRTAIDNFGFEQPDDRRLLEARLSNDFEFFGDPDLFTHVLFNLVGNALYYRNRPEFRIEITLSEGGASNRITVRDTGPGIPAEKLELIFNQFYTAGKTGGNGLGLAFCRRVVESFGGTIICRSDFGKWTEFIIELPGSESETVRHLQHEVLGSKKVLIVDDQVPNRLLLAKFLTDMNCMAEQAANGRAALDMAAKTCYDLILMDIEMPVLNGDDAVRKLRTGQGLELSMALHYRDVPIIGVTGLAENEAIRRTIYSGMDDYLLKPVSRKTLKKYVERAFFSDRPGQAEPQLVGISGAAILVVDDNATSRTCLKALLEPLGYKVFLAENGQAALESICNDTIDLVILDMQMPLMDGLETAKAIRNGKSGICRDLPIISLSGYSDEQSAMNARKNGIDVHLGKPVNRHKLATAIANLLSRTEKFSTNRAEGNATPWLALEKLPILDLAVIHELENLGDTAFLSKLFGLFIQEAEQLIREIDEACRNQEREKARRTCHTLKGSAGSVGAARMQNIAMAMDELLRNQRCPKTEGWIDYLVQVFRQTETACRKQRERPPVKKGAAAVTP